MWLYCALGILVGWYGRAGQSARIPQMLTLGRTHPWNGKGLVSSRKLSYCFIVKSISLVNIYRIILVALFRIDSGIPSQQHARWGHLI